MAHINFIFFRMNNINRVELQSQIHQKHSPKVYQKTKPESLPEKHGPKDYQKTKPETLTRIKTQKSTDI